MRENRIEIRVSVKEKDNLKKVAAKFGLPLSDYVRRKLFFENEEMATTDVYVSPYEGKNNLLTISILHKILYFVREVMRKQGMSPGEVIEIDKESLEYAREARKRYGYKLIKGGDE